MILRLTSVVLVLLLATPIALEAQPARKVWKVGLVFLAATPERAQRVVNRIEAGLGDLGHVPGKDFVIELRLARGDRERLPSLLRELVDTGVDVILAPSNTEIAAAKQVTSTIPIVMLMGVNPVASGFVASLARPGANITGATFDATPDIGAKQVELLKELVPGATRLAVLSDPSFPGLAPYIDTMKAAASRLGIRTRSVTASRIDEFPSAFALLSRQRDDAVLVVGSTIFVAHRADIVAMLNSKHLPAIYHMREFVELGGLMSYGQSVGALWARAPVFLDKIFRGAKPADLPVEQPTKFELVLNAKTAKTLGLTIPPSLLIRADQLIE